jgi:transposase
MMGGQSAPAKLFYDFDLESHVPDDHLLRQVDRTATSVPRATSFSSTGATTRTPAEESPTKGGASTGR